MEATVKVHPRSQLPTGIPRFRPGARVGHHERPDFRAVIVSQRPDGWCRIMIEGSCGGPTLIAPHYLIPLS